MGKRTATPQGLPPLKKGEQYVTGADAFEEQLARIPRGRKLSPAELRTSFASLFDALEALWEKEGLDTPEKRKLGSVKRAEKLSEDHPVCAFGYPMTYIRVVSGEVGRKEFELALNTRV